MRILVIINQKGGCGKTTTAISLAGIFAARGKKTLLVDLDPQSHCAAGLAIPEQRVDLDIGDAMLSDTPVEASRLMWRVTRGLDLIPSRLKLAGLEAARGGLAAKPDKERRLARVLESIDQQHEVVVVDCSPSVGLLTYNALACATDVVVPVETSFFSLQGATKQINTIRSLERRLGVSAPYSILPTIHEPESALAEDLIGELRRRFDGRVCPIAIRRDAKLKEAASFGQPVTTYAPDSTGATDYGLAADWLLPSLAHPGVARPVTPKPLTAAVTETTNTVKPTVKPFVETTPVADNNELGLVRRVLDRTISADSSVVAAVTTVSKATTDGNAPPIGGAHTPARPASAPSATTTTADTTADRAARRTPGLNGSVTLIEPTPPTIAHGPAGTNGPNIGSRVDAGQGSTAHAGIIGTSAVRLVEDDDPVAPARTPMTGTFLLVPESRKLRRETTPGVYVETDSVLFVQPIGAGTKISLAGDFNHWSSASHVMERLEIQGVHRLRIPMLEGRYRYRLVVDGDWMCDPTNPDREPNEFGDFNSVVVRS
ncbi:MAG: AAA family ATPase [Planctomycetota bacterium]